MVGYLDPTSAAVGYNGAVAVNLALGGSLDNFDPAIQFFKDLKKNEPIVPKQTSYARVLSGEIPILFDYDFNAYRAKYKDNANVEFVIPTEGTIVAPYVMGLVKNSPQPDNGKKILDFVLSDQGQTLWANAYLRPVRATALSPEMAAKFLPASEYARAKTIDLKKMADVQEAFRNRYLNEVRLTLSSPRGGVRHPVLPLRTPPHFPERDRGIAMNRRLHPYLVLLFLPALAVFTAFFFLPLGRLSRGLLYRRRGLELYLAILTTPRYLEPSSTPCCSQARSHRPPSSSPVSPASS